MAQDVVTARDAAAPSEIATQKQDLQRICDTLDNALVHEGFRRPQYSEHSGTLLKLAWAVAAHKRSRQVTLFHLAYALVFDQPGAAANLVEFLGTDFDTFAVGCILNILPLGVSTGDPEVLPPAVATVRWLGHAIKLARTRGQQSELVPEDLVQIVLDGSIPASELSLLKRAARVGTARRDAVLGPKTENSLTSAPKDGDPFTYIETIEKARDTTGSLDGIADLAAVFEDFDQRYTADATEQKLAMAAINRDLSRLDAPIEPINETMRSMAALESKMASLAESLPRPPSSAQIAGTIIAVLLIGGTIGIFLTSLQPALDARPVAVTAPNIGK